MIGWQPFQRCVVGATVVLLVVEAGCGRNTPSQPTTPPVPATAAAPATGLPPWQPDPASVDQLGPYQDVEGYQIRLPKYYDSVPPPRALPSGQNAFYWMGPSGRTITVSFATLPPGSVGGATLSEYLDKTMAALAKAVGGSDWRRTPSESGKMGGINFLRAGWQTSNVNVNVKMYGIAYRRQERRQVHHDSGHGHEPNQQRRRLQVGRRGSYDIS